MKHVLRPRQSWFVVDIGAKFRLATGQCLESRLKSSPKYRATAQLDVQDRPQEQSTVRHGVRYHMIETRSIRTSCGT
jgi:hypothetical protein